MTRSCKHFHWRKIQSNSSGFCSSDSMRASEQIAKEATKDRKMIANGSGGHGLPELIGVLKDIAVQFAIILPIGPAADVRNEGQHQFFRPFLGGVNFRCLLAQ